MGSLKVDMFRISSALVLTCAVFGMGCSDDRDSTADRNSPLGECPDGNNPNFLTDADNCGACGVRCDDLNGAAMCQAGICRLTDEAKCDLGFFDVDGNPSNGCECMGASARTCRTCLAYEVPMNGIDDDCRPGTTDLGPGAEAIDIPVTRAHCGAQNASCLLPPGALDVRCQLVRCTPSQAARGECGLCEGFSDDGNRLCGQCIGVGESPDFEAPQDCFDGVDQDDNGIVDDGPYCEALLANAATSACNLASPDAECPPNVVEIPTAGGPLSTLEIGLTYDLLYDRYEVNRAQFAAFLEASGRCNPNTQEQRPTQCDVTEREARLPVTEVSWCAAYDYCSWAGKRLPTVAEFYRAASADTTGGVGETDAQGVAQPDTELCAGNRASVLAECAAEGLEEVDSGAGLALIGHPGRWPADVLVGRSLHHLTGNVAEWLFDAAVDWCAEDGPHALPAFRDITCPTVGEMVQRRLLLDWAPSPADRPDGELVLRPGQQRMMCGGGWASAPGTAGYDHQQRVTPGVRAAHHGFRCARTFHPDPASADNWPYERLVEARARAICDPLPLAGVSARKTHSERVYKAVDACLPGFDRDQIAGLRHRVSHSLVSVFMTIDGKDDQARHIRLQAGIDAGAEQLWLAGLDPVRAHARVPAACNDGRCEVLVLDEPTDPLVVPPTLVLPHSEAVVQAQGLTVDAISIGRQSPCLDPGTTPVEIDVQLDRDGFWALIAGPDGPEQDDELAGALAEHGLCLDPEEGCTRWQVALNLGFDEVEALEP